MRGTERIIFAFRPFGETGKSAAGTQRANPIAPAGQDFVRIGLVSNVPNQSVCRGIEYVMQRNGKLDNSQARTKMSTSHSDGGNRFSAQLVGYLLQVGSA
jgi:hypothetical protein